MSQKVCDGDALRDDRRNADHVGHVAKNLERISVSVRVPDLVSKAFGLCPVSDIRTVF